MPSSIEFVDKCFVPAMFPTARRSLFCYLRAAFFVKDNMYYYIAGHVCRTAAFARAARAIWRRQVAASDRRRRPQQPAFCHSRRSCSDSSSSVRRSASPWRPPPRRPPIAPPIAPAATRHRPRRGHRRRRRRLARRRPKSRWRRARTK